MDSIDKPPAKAFLVNLQTMEAVDVQFNPTVIDRDTKTAWQASAIIGASFQPLDYLNTENSKMNLEFYLRAENSKEYLSALDTLNFIESLQYPPEDSDGIGGARPPRVLVVWPGSVSITCVVDNVNVKHVLFDSKGRTRQWTVKVDFVEARRSRLTQEAVRKRGAIRSSDIES